MTFAVSGWSCRWRWWRLPGSAAHCGKPNRPVQRLRLPTCLKRHRGPGLPSGIAPTRRGSESSTGRSVDDRPLVAYVYGSGEDTVLLVASIHGNEIAGTPLLRRLGAYLVEQPRLAQGRRVILVPVVNPDGVSMNRRGNLHGVDLNRNFPALNYSASGRHGAAALSEPESRALASLIDRLLAQADCQHPSAAGVHRLRRAG